MNAGQASERTTQTLQGLKIKVVLDGAGEARQIYILPFVHYKSGGKSRQRPLEASRRVCSLDKEAERVEVLAITETIIIEKLAVVAVLRTHIVVIAAKETRVFGGGDR